MVAKSLHATPKTNDMIQTRLVRSPLVGQPIEITSDRTEISQQSLEAKYSKAVHIRLLQSIDYIKDVKKFAIDQVEKIAADRFIRVSI